MIVGRAAGASAVVALSTVLSGCGTGQGSGGPPPDVQVSTGTREITARPTQYCLDGEWQRYTVTPPIVEVAPDAAISLTVPDAVAERGWSVQVFDESLEETIGEVDVPAGTTTFDGISSSDIVPPTFYLVVVEDSGGRCDDLSGAWPVGFFRAGG